MLSIYIVCTEGTINQALPNTQQHFHQQLQCPVIMISCYNQLLISKIIPMEQYIAEYLRINQQQNNVMVN
jgi:hypothetical protein